MRVLWVSIATGRVTIVRVAYRIFSGGGGECCDNKRCLLTCVCNLIICAVYIIFYYYGILIVIICRFCMTYSSMDDKWRVYDSIRLPHIFLGSPGTSLCNVYSALSPLPEGPRACVQGYEIWQFLC